MVGSASLIVCSADIWVFTLDGPGGVGRWEREIVVVRVIVDAMM